MIIKYTTKRDVNGNRYCLLVDMEKKTYKRDYNTGFSYNDYITIGKRDREKLIDNLILCGFLEA